MSKKFKMEITDKVNAITYDGCVTIKCFSIVNGKKVINIHNKGENALFESIVHALRGDSFDRPAAVRLGNSEHDDAIGVSYAYRTTPLLYHATYQGDGVYIYSAISESDPSSTANCLSYEFTIPSGAAATGTKITKLKLVNGNKVFASVQLGSDKEITIDSTSNIQIYWRLIFKSVD